MSEDLYKQIWKVYQSTDAVPEQFSKEWMKQKPHRKAAKKAGITKDGIVAHINEQKAILAAKKSKHKSSKHKIPGMFLSFAAAGVLALGYGAYKFGYTEDNTDGNDNIALVSQEYGITLDDLRSIRGVSDIVRSYGESPKVIFVGDVHMDLSQEVQSNEVDLCEGITQSICFELNDRYDIDNLVCEGMTSRLVDNYNENGSFQCRGDPALNSSTQYFLDRCDKLFSACDWNILVSEDPVADNVLKRILRPIFDLRAEFTDEYKQITAQAFTNNSRVEPGGNISYNRRAASAEISAGYDDLLADYRGRIRNILDRNLDEFYANIVNRRENYLVDLARTADGPLIVKMGLAHTHTLADKLERAGIPYACLALDCLDIGRYERRSRAGIRDQFLQLPYLGSIPVNGHFDRGGKFILE